MRYLLLLLAAVIGAVGLALATAGHGLLKHAATTTSTRHHAVAVKPPAPPPAPARPPQFIVVGFDGAGGRQMMDYWRKVGRRAHATFTFFVSGVYLLDWANHNLYRPPHHDAGTSAIGFALPTGDLTVTKTLAGVTAAFHDGDEIGTHYNGHFCSPDPGSVGNWTAADWTSELKQFDGLLFGTGTALPFRPSEIVGSRTPCLEGNPKVLYPVLAKRGFSYDASQIDLLGTWPRRELGIWSFPLPEIPFIGHTFRVIGMDYNFFANQVDETPARAESEAYRSLWNAFRAGYFGSRAPLTIGQHFETWKSWAYDHALARFLVRACRQPEVRCVSYRGLASFLDSVPPARLRRYEQGRFPRLRASRTILNRG